MDLIRRFVPGRSSIVVDPAGNHHEHLYTAPPQPKPAHVQDELQLVHIRQCIAEMFGRYSQALLVRVRQRVEADPTL
jgi:hypothetical protein